MPTPRFLSAALRANRARPAQASDAGSWTPGTVVSVGGAINGVLRVALDGGETVSATSTLDFPIEEGQSVYVVRTADGHVVAGLR